jgi:hypothetical protein
MRYRVVVLVVLLALVGAAALPAGTGDGEPCTTIEKDGKIYVYPENCVPQNGNQGQSPGP